MATFKGFPADDYNWSAREVGLALAGLVGRLPSGLPKAGMLVSAPVLSAVPSTWKVEVSPFVYVKQVDGAIQLSGVSAAEQVDVLPASGSVGSGQARVDVVCWNPDTSQLSVITGTPAASPVAPSIGSLVRVGTARVNYGDAGLVAARVVSDAVVTAMGGTIIPWTQAVTSGSPTDRARLMGAWTNNINANWDGLKTTLQGGRVELTGAIWKAGAFASQEVIANLPVGMRPPVPTMLPAAYAVPGGYVLVRVNGDIITSQAGSGGQIAIGGGFAVGAF